MEHTTDYSAERDALDLIGKYDFMLEKEPESVYSLHLCG